MVDPKTILLVEDEVLIALGEQRILEQEGYHVLLAGSGEAAVELVCARQAPVDLILMDINLGPGIDGTQAAERILQVRDIPVVFLSSHTEKEVVEKTKEITSYGYIVKDSGSTVLIASIEMAFKLHSAHARLRERETHVQAMLQAVPDLIFRLNRQGIFLDYKADRKDLYEQPTNIIGQSIHATTPPEFADLIMGKIQQTLDTGQMQTFEYRLPMPDRGLREYEARMAASGADEVTAIVRDITDRTQAERELIESESRYRRIVEGAPDIIYIYSTKRGSLYNSPQVETILGYPPADLQQNPFLWIESIHPDDARIMMRVSAPDYGKRIPDVEYRIRNARGEWIWVRDRIFRRTIQGDETLLEGMVTDITARKQAEAERERLLWQISAVRDAATLTNDRLLALLERISEGIIALDQNWNYAYLNTQAGTLLGHSPAALLGRNFWDVFPEARGTPFGSAYLRAMETQQFVAVEDVYGPWNRRFENRIYPAPDGLTIFFHEIQPSKPAGPEAGQRSGPEQPVEQNILLREMHHRIKNNLSTISGLLTFQAANSDPHSAQILIDADSRIRSMLWIYEQLYQSGTYQIVNAREYLTKLVREIAASLQPSNQSIRLSAEIADIALPVRQSYPIGLFVNECLTNAYKYAFVGRSSGEIRFALRQQNDQLELEIADDGIGISPLLNLERPASFGLQLIQLMAKQLNGQLAVDVTAGTCFRLSFLPDSKS